MNKYCEILNSERDIVYQNLIRKGLPKTEETLTILGLHLFHNIKQCYFMGRNDGIMATTAAQVTDRFGVDEERMKELPGALEMILNQQIENVQRKVSLIEYPSQRQRTEGTLKSIKSSLYLAYLDLVKMRLPRKRENYNLLKAHFYNLLQKYYDQGSKDGIWLNRNIRGLITEKGSAERWCYLADRMLLQKLSQKALKKLPKRKNKLVTIVKT